MTDLMVRALRPFEGVEGYKDETSEPFGVSQDRYKELSGRGLVRAMGDALQAETSTDALAAALSDAETRLQAAKDAADKAIAAEEARFALAKSSADEAIAAEEARVAEAKAAADRAVEAEQARLLAITNANTGEDGAAKVADEAENKMADEPDNKAAQRSTKKAS